MMVLSRVLTLLQLVPDLISGFRYHLIKSTRVRRYGSVPVQHVRPADGSPVCCRSVLRRVRSIVAKRVASCAFYGATLPDAARRIPANTGADS